MLGTAVALHGLDGSQDRDHHGRRPPNLPPAHGSQRQRPRRLSRPDQDQTEEEKEEDQEGRRGPTTPPGAGDGGGRRPSPHGAQASYQGESACCSWAVTCPTLRAGHQTLARTYTFQEADLVDLLITYDHLVCQETAALEEKISHEPALSLVRRLLREGKPLPKTLPTARSLNRRIHFYDHVGEKDWVQFTDDQQTSDQDTIDDALLLLDEDMDLTDEEMARLLGQ
ncbi:hypothetical protein GWK47_050007 [Chionoecetes opilio]|uniref:Uncharacterized protein n=1 Tax=Chionoecetes opilio TaxID=41210 RepID=A0A8J4Y1W6_CHIOP|nr:hypothetical protein GWK47_050007 [Chionoecetes opilio]